MSLPPQFEQTCDMLLELFSVSLLCIDEREQNLTGKEAKPAKRRYILAKPPGRSSVEDGRGGEGRGEERYLNLYLIGCILSLGTRMTKEREI